MLTKRSRIVLDTFLPSQAHPNLPHGLFDVGFDDFYADFKKQAIPSIIFGFQFALFLAIWVAPLLLRKIPPITLYDRTERERILNAMYASRSYLIRQMFLIIKMTVCFCYGAAPEVRNAIGYPVQFDDPAYQPSPVGNAAPMGRGEPEVKV